MENTAPDKILLHKKSRTLELFYGETSNTLSAEFLRVHSPSAEVQGHGPDQAVLQHGKAEVGIDKLEAAGHYGLRIYFDDGHDTGIFHWDYFLELIQNQQRLEAQYDQALKDAGLSKLPHTQVLNFPSN